MKLNKKIVINILNKIDSLSDIEFSEKEKIYYFCTLHDIGLIRYDNLTSKNYYYWWYEVDLKDEKPNENRFTAPLKDFSLTQKGRLFLKLTKNNNFINSNVTEIYLTAMQLIDDPAFLIENINPSYQLELKF